MYPTGLVKPVTPLRFKIYERSAQMAFALIGRLDQAKPKLEILQHQYSEKLGIFQCEESDPRPTNTSASVPPAPQPAELRAVGWSADQPTFPARKKLVGLKTKLHRRPSIGREGRRLDVPGGSSRRRWFYH